MISNQHDDALRDLLRTRHTVTPVLSPRFRSEVWARIEARRSTPATWLAWTRLHFAGVATAAVASMVLSAGAAGWVAVRQAGQDREMMVSRYVTSIDPHRQLATTGTARGQP